MIIVILFFLKILAGEFFILMSWFFCTKSKQIKACNFCEFFIFNRTRVFFIFLKKQIEEFINFKRNVAPTGK
ncbi:hypothetical protein B4903_04710 [Yersinia frederiksenii]|nr:hypothetical protein B4903_04710 [Yersinia frederiksenii]